MKTGFALTLILGLLGQTTTGVPPSMKDDATTRLAFMRDSLKLYNVHPLAPAASSFKLDPEPIFRMNNPVGGVKDGAIFFWLGAHGRPEAAVQAFLIPNGDWLHELTSLSPAPFVAETGRGAAWIPSRAGVGFKPIAGAPKPAATAEQRLRQMRALSQDFSAEDYFEDKEWHTLRLLARPLARYGKPGTDVEDGALFSFALGTDPEVLLLIEARRVRGVAEWYFAFAPMTAYAVKGFWKNKPVWELPWRQYAKEPREPFYIRNHSREN